jgi:molecular chaperone DnaK
MTITGQSATNREEIERMMRDAELHAEEDKKRRDEAEVRNAADTLVYNTEKLLKEQGDKASADDRQKIESALKQLKDAIAGTDVDAVRRGHEELTTAVSAFSSSLYQQAAAAAQGAQGGAGGPDGATSGPADDEVADAEIVDEERGA